MSKTSTPPGVAADPTTSVPAGLSSGFGTDNPTPFSSPDNPTNTPPAVPSATTFGGEADTRTPRERELEAELARLRGDQPTAAAPGAVEKSHQWAARVVEADGKVREIGWMQTSQNSKLDADEAKRHTLWSQYEAAGKDSPQSVEVVLIDPKQKRPAKYQWPSVVGGKVRGGVVPEPAGVKP